MAADKFAVMRVDDGPLPHGWWTVVHLDNDSGPDGSLGWIHSCAQEWKIFHTEAEAEDYARQLNDG